MDYLVIAYFVYLLGPIKILSISHLCSFPTILIFFICFDGYDTYFPILPVTYVEGAEIVWIFEMRPKCTYKYYLADRRERYDIVPFDTSVPS